MIVEEKAKEETEKTGFYEFDRKEKAESVIKERERGKETQQSEVFVTFGERNKGLGYVMSNDRGRNVRGKESVQQRERLSTRSRVRGEGNSVGGLVFGLTFEF